MLLEPGAVFVPVTCRVALLCLSRGEPRRGNGGKREEKNQHWFGFKGTGWKERAYSELRRLLCFPFDESTFAAALDFCVGWSDFGGVFVRRTHCHTYPSDIVLLLVLESKLAALLLNHYYFLQSLQSCCAVDRQFYNCNVA